MNLSLNCLGKANKFLKPKVHQYSAFFGVAMVALCMAPTEGVAQQNSGLNSDVKELLKTPLTELLKRQNVTVTSVSKKAENLSDAAAAIYVITAEDIRRAGVASIPEALRLAPGMQVARIDSNKWAISARGLNAQLANKLLVLIDGRDVYTPLFSGVNWDVQDLLLEDIDRIEVVRGSGATLWGANAVNGVVNIITKSAKATPATLVTTTVGNLDNSIGARKGGAIGDDFYYRTYVKGFKRGETETLAGNDANDDWDQLRTGFRSDWDASFSDNFTFQGDIYKGTENRHSILPVVAPTFSITRNTEEKRKGGNFLARWKQKQSNVSETSLQFYFDHIVRDNNTLKQNRRTYDLDFQHSWDFTPRNEFIWGAGYRYIDDDFDNSEFISFDPEEREYDLLSAFVQNKYAVIPDELFFTVGSKFEHNDYTGFEFQPNVRALWKVTENQTFWGAVSRSVRTPSRAEDDIEFIVSLANQTGTALASQRGQRQYESEKLVSYELGYRVSPSENVFIDAAVFLNDYGNMATLEQGALDLSTGTPVIPFSPFNYGDVTTHGFELSSDWRVTKDWHLIANYTYTEIKTSLDAGSTDTFLEKDEGETPSNQFSIRSQYDLPYDLELDSALFYVGSLPSADIDHYVRMDARLGWSPLKDLDVSLVGQNLLHARHQEFSGPVHGLASEIPRSYFAKVTMRF